jgi:alkaline phosphatase D
MNMKQLIYAACFLLCGALAVSAQTPDSAGPYQATGIKIGEVTDSAAIVWTRLTRMPERVGKPAPEPEILCRNPRTGETEKAPKERPDWTPVIVYPEGTSIDSIEGAVPGASGEVRVQYQIEANSAWMSTEWMAVEADRDFTRQFRLTSLQPDTRYLVRVESRDAASQQAGQSVEGRFRTAPRPEAAARVSFGVSTGQAYPHQDAEGGGYKIYPAMLELDLSFFVHTGDILYYDALAKSLELARWHWARMYSLPTNVEFQRVVPTYFIKDDHDTWMNDCYPNLKTKFMGDFTFQQGQAVFLEQVPMGERTYRTFRWGKDLQIWLVEGRDFRSSNPLPDGPEKTIWGAEQKDWFKRTVAESDATFRVLISPTPLVGPDRTNKNDNHANKGFATEGRELREFIAKQNNMVILCGDRHWQYVSVDRETGVREYSCGPASDQHAGGWKQEDLMPEHRYLKVVGGFLEVTVERIDGVPAMFLRHHGVDGELLHEDRLPVQ